MEDEPKPSIVIFGRDVTKIPCFRNTFLYGIPTYIGVGLTAFLFTSRSALSSHIGFTAFTVVSLGYWINCRFNYDKERLQMTKMRDSIYRASILEGTESDPAVRRKVRKTPKLEEA